MKHIKDIFGVFESMFDDTFDVTRTDMYKSEIDDCLGHVDAKYSIDGDTLNIQKYNGTAELLLFDIDKLAEIGIKHITTAQDTYVRYRRPMAEFNDVSLKVKGRLIFRCVDRDIGRSNMNVVIDNANIQCKELDIMTRDDTKVTIRKSRLNITRKLTIDTDRFKILASNKISCPTFEFRCSDRMGNHDRLREDMGLGSMDSLSSYLDFCKQMNVLSKSDPAKYYETFCDIDPLKVLKLDKVRWPNLGKIIISNDPLYICYSAVHGYVLWNIRKGVLPISNDRLLDTSIEYENHWYANAFTMIHENE